MLSDERLAEIKARCEAATPGPWKRIVDRGGETAISIVKKDEIIGHGFAILNPQDEFNETVFTDSDFVAHSRADIPALVAEVERQRAEIGRLRGALKELERAADPNQNMSDIPLIEALSVARAALESSAPVFIQSPVGSGIVCRNCGRGPGEAGGCTVCVDAPKEDRS